MIFPLLIGATALLLSLGTVEAFTVRVPVMGRYPTLLPASAQPLFDRIGGDAAVKATVDAMYTRILDDPSLSPFFAETDMKTQKDHQVMFLARALGGMKADYDIATFIKEKHAKSMSKGLNEDHFDAVAGHVVDSLESLNVDQSLIDEVVEVLAPLRPLFETK